MPTQTTMIRDDDNPNQTDLVAGSILDDLSHEEADRLNQAIAQSPAIAGEIESFREAFALLPYDMPLLEPSARLKDKIISAALQSAVVPHPDPPESNVVPFAPSRRNWKQWIPAIATSIAAGAVIALGLNQVQLSRQVQQTVALQQQLEAKNTELKRLQSELQANQKAIARLSQPGTTDIFAGWRNVKPEKQPSCYGTPLGKVRRSHRDARCSRDAQALRQSNLSALVSCQAILCSGVLRTVSPR